MKTAALQINVKDFKGFGDNSQQIKNLEKTMKEMGLDKQSSMLKTLKIPKNDYTIKAFQQIQMEMEKGKVNQEKLNIQKQLGIAPKEDKGMLSQILKGIGLKPQEQSGENGMGKTVGLLGKMTGMVAIISLIMEGLEPILKPIFSILKAMIMILFMPLIPILKPILIILGAFAKMALPVLISMKNGIDSMLDVTINPILTAMSAIMEVIGKIDGKIVELFFTILLTAVKLMTPLLPLFVKGLDFIAAGLNWFLENINIVLPKIESTLTWFADQGGALFLVILDALASAGTWLLNSWTTIKGIMDWAGTSLDKVWTVIKGILESAGNSILPILKTVIMNLGDMLVLLYNSLATAVNAITKIGTFGMGGTNFKSMDSLTNQVSNSEKNQKSQSSKDNLYNPFDTQVSVINPFEALQKKSNETSTIVQLNNEHMFGMSKQSFPLGWAIGEAQKAFFTFTQASGLNYQLMSSKVQLETNNIVNQLNKIPKEIVTIHRIVTVYENKK